MKYVFLSMLILGNTASLCACNNSDDLRDADKKISVVDEQTESSDISYVYERGESSTDSSVESSNDSSFQNTESEDNSVGTSTQESQNTKNIEVPIKEWGTFTFKDKDNNSMVGHMRVIDVVKSSNDLSTVKAKLDDYNNYGVIVNGSSVAEVSDFPEIDKLPEDEEYAIVNVELKYDEDCVGLYYPDNISLGIDGYKGYVGTMVSGGSVGATFGKDKVFKGTIIFSIKKNIEDFTLSYTYIDGGSEKSVVCYAY